jgi:hypothetical protein
MPERLPGDLYKEHTHRILIRGRNAGGRTHALDCDEQALPDHNDILTALCGARVRADVDLRRYTALIARYNGQACQNCKRMALQRYHEAP